MERIERHLLELYQKAGGGGGERPKIFGRFAENQNSSKFSILT